MRIIAFVLVLLVACATPQQQEYDITVYKTPSCGCCGLYVKYLEGKGLNVHVIERTNLDDVKTGIPKDLWSCHTSKMGKYTIEGHVPIEVLEKLKAEQPDIDGVALPGMPAGSPGMGGAKQGEWTIYSIKDGKEKEFMRV